ncbi:DUF2589 domain-containing protein [Ferrimonas sediminicola]|uniref:DUF2589 domain-containing protein n=1 Tax=Ferrimonas sediminicola TaxID=2569538 RepID=A0A4U1B9A9_9GAMM|nr:DUF2589 domain-containing protein [Ferrimonas sediminicola]TKB47327.1 DUF2589 domain-containing protein [Ferrimonas sediminicola]
MKLHDLVEAIMDSVTEAQQRVERQNISNLLQYFDHDPERNSFSPKSVELVIPQHATDDQGEVIMDEQGAQTEENRVQVPLIALLQLNPIKIRDMAIKFDVGLGEVETLKSAAGSGVEHKLASMMAQDPCRKVMNTDLGGRAGFGLSRKGRNAEVTITFESGELPEGYLKVNSHLMKLF